LASLSFDELDFFAAAHDEELCLAAVAIFEKHARRLSRHVSVERVERTLSVSEEHASLPVPLHREQVSMIVAKMKPKWRSGASKKSAVRRRHGANRKSRKTASGLKHGEQSRRRHMGDWYIGCMGM